MTGFVKTFPLAAAILLATGAVLGSVQLAWAGGGFRETPRNEFTDEFFLEDCDFSSTGSNRFFILEPGYRLHLSGEERDGTTVVLTVTVLDETNVVDGVGTRVVEERETADGELVEVSRNYFAICDQTNSVFYFGEDVDIYEAGEVVSHAGAWLAGEDGARAGLFMPGIVTLGSRYFQEVAPGVAMDRAEIISLNEQVDTPAGTFEDVLKILETTPLEPGQTSYKFWAAGVGLIQDGDLKLAESGFVDAKEID